MSFDSDLITYFIKGNSHIIVYEFGMCYNLENEPSSFEETMKSRDAMFWKEVIDDEMESLCLPTHGFLYLPFGSKPKECKWIYWQV